ncbi:hypothetical protein [Glutamicibacter protophormiae]|uniref:Lycopene cyclase domain-containing protein n=1 Tax=Glutamicibacter protophormiae TaxID=37930 RepID=A0ABS4XUL1_GLUPR|nr:hypothetical protein [Glutamicibacter protophormiae]MBP2400209.1 hypothetical protein [Glutamicibacter protophormiae]GGL74445.1 hypothetical protein GCM10010038_00530 [Glutamicibacter protophormiae]
MNITLYPWLVTVAVIVLLSLKTLFQRRSEFKKFIPGLWLLVGFVLLGPVGSLGWTLRMGDSYDPFFDMPFALNFALIVFSRFDPMGLFSGEEPLEGTWLKKTVDGKFIYWFIEGCVWLGLALFFFPLAMDIFRSSL